jgi:hypothetical protein
MTRTLICAGQAMVILLACIAATGNKVETDANSVGAKTNTGESADVLAHQLVRNELKAEDEDKTRWMYRVEHDEPGKSEIKEVIETKAGTLERLLFLNGRPLSAEEQKKEDERLKRVCADPHELEKQQRERQKDGDEARDLLKLLPDAFNFTYGGTRGDIVKLNFKPNPNFHPPTREARVFHGMVGSVWMNEKELRLAGIAGELVQEVKFGAGLLGHLDKGGSFQVKQEEVGEGHWDMTFLEVNMNGKALFFRTITVREKELHSAFRRVPDSLTLEQAANLLKQQSSAGASH